MYVVLLFVVETSTPFWKFQVCEATAIYVPFQVTPVTTFRLELVTGVYCVLLIVIHLS